MDLIGTWRIPLCRETNAVEVRQKRTDVVVALFDLWSEILHAAVRLITSFLYGVSVR